MRVRKIKQAKRKHQVENLVLKIMIVIAVILVLGAVGGVAFCEYLLTQCGYQKGGEMGEGDCVTND